MNVYIFAKYNKNNNDNNNNNNHKLNRNINKLRKNYKRRKILKI